MKPGRDSMVRAGLRRLREMAMAEFHRLQAEYELHSQAKGHIERGAPANATKEGRQAMLNALDLNAVMSLNGSADMKATAKYIDELLSLDDLPERPVAPAP